jgi:hypothetical protein
MPAMRAYTTAVVSEDGTLETETISVPRHFEEHDRRPALGDWLRIWAWKVRARN